MKREFVSIEFKKMNMGQMLFVQAVVLPEIIGVLDKYAKDIAELETGKEI